MVIEEPENPRNIGTIIRNVNALGAEKVYVVDPRKVLPDDWHHLRSEPKLSKLSVSAVKWTFVRRFDSSEECLAHLEKSRFVSIATSPHVKGKTNRLLHEADFADNAKLAVSFRDRRRTNAPSDCGGKPPVCFRRSRGVTGHSSEYRTRAMPDTLIVKRVCISDDDQYHKSLQPADSRYEPPLANAPQRVHHDIAQV